MPHPVDSSAASLLADTLLRVSASGIILYQPITAADGRIEDFQFVRVNAAAQQRLALPERPAQTFLQQYPHAAAQGVFAFYCHAYASGELRQFSVDYPGNSLNAYFQLTAQRCGELLVISFADVSHRHNTSVETLLREGRRLEHAARVAAETQYAQLQRVLDQAPALLCILAGPELVVEFTNAAYRQLLGGRELVGQPLGQALPELAAQGYLDLLDKVYHSGELLHAVEQPATLDFARTGAVETRYFTFSYQPRRGATGRVDGVIVLGYDATEQVRARQQVLALNQDLAGANQRLESRVHARTRELQQARAEAEHQRARLERLFRTAPAIVNTNVGPDHVFELVHPLTDQLFGFRPLAGLPIRDALPDVEAAFFDLMDRVYRTGQPYHGRGVPVRAGPAGGPLTEAYFDFTYQPLRAADGQIEGVMTFAVNVTEQVRARQLAEQNEARFRRLAETAPLIVWEADAAGQTTYLSPYWEQITSAANGQGLDWRAYVHPDDQAALVQAWQACVRTEQPFQHELRLRLAATGDYRWFLDRADPVRDPAGHVVQWVGAAADIDAQKRVQQALQASEQYFRDMADLVPTLIWQTDAHGACVYLNASWYAYTGQRPGEALGYGWQQAVHPEDLARVAELALPAVAAGQPFTAVYRLRNAAGQYRWITDSGRPRVDAQGNAGGYLGSVTDIDEQKRAEQALQLLAGELRTAHAHAQQLNDELAARNAQLQRLNEELDTFVYMAAHDLRAPLLDIEGLVHALGEDLPPAAVPPDAARLLHLLRGTTQRFKDLVEGMTAVARAQQPPTAFEEVDLLPVIDAVQLDLQPLIRQTRARIDVASSGCARATLAPPNARSVVYNLLSNALKYRHPDRAPRVRVACYDEEPYTVLTVQDNGLGLDAAAQAALFAPFQRLHHHVEGHGLGLYMIKRLVENAGGRIEVDSQDGWGTTFRVFLRR
ncbi:hypothetical protein GCM10027048_32250 [Hymenobacter coalescens]|uniref:histidine kinase n=1 Tax=Hymenobacter koreensis TaxID=1084523 RepID=A0ABP8JDI3_9BACT